MKFLPLFLLIALGLSSCANSHMTSKPTASPMSQKMSQRFTKPDMEKKSVYNKDMQASLNAKDGAATGALGRKTYGTKKFTGNKAFGRTSKFKTSEYSGGDTKNKWSSDKFLQSGKKSSYSTRSYTTKKSRDQNKTPADADRAYMNSLDTFKTSSNRDALKAQKKNTKPTVIELDKKGRKPAYTESQVKSLMGRQ